MTPSGAETTGEAPGGRPGPRIYLALLAGWLVPGLGHLLVGRARRGALFALLVLGSYGLGMAHDARLALSDPRQPFLTSLQVIANLGIGPLDLVVRYLVYGRLAYELPIQTLSAKDRAVGEIFRDRTRSALSIYGTAYAWTAGLMNLLLLFDIWDIGRSRRATHA